MQVAIGFLLRRRHPQPAEDGRFSQMKPDQQVHKLPAVDPIGLGPPLPPVDFDARGIDDHVFHPVRRQAAMQPKSVAAGLEATAYRGLLG
jgi:hypothetical protein